jgi:hypothetical protein
MKTLKTAVLAGVMAAVCVGGLQAADVSITGAVASISDHNFSASSLTLGTGLTVGSNTDTVIGVLTISNNDPDGFRVSVSSATGGKLGRYNSSGNGTYYSSDETAAGTFAVGDAADYTIDFVPNSVPGTVGATVPAAFLNATNVALTSAQTFDFTDPTQATVSAKYDMRIQTTADNTLLNSAANNDSFRDVITISVANL